MNIPENILRQMGIDPEKSKKEQEKKEREEEKKRQERYKSYNKSNNHNQKSKYNGSSSNFRNGGNLNQYVGAPYNFVPFSKKVYEVKEKTVSHASLEEELISGEIRYKITSHTPIFIGAGEGKNGEADVFYRNAKGQFAIPGSSVRGLIKSNVQILSMSSFGDDVDDYALMYRSVGTSKNDPNKAIYNTTLGSDTISVNGKPVSILKRVKAGYLVNENGEYNIYHTKPDYISKEFEEMNYYYINERIIIETSINNPESTAFAYLFKNNRTQNRPGVMFYKDEEKNPVQYYQKDRFGKKDHNKDYQPYYEPISYELKDNRTVSAIGAPDKFKLQGYLVGTGYMQMKKALYVIPERDMEKHFTIPDADIKAFQIDYEKKKNGLRVNRKESLFGLPKEGVVRPVFYIELNGRLYFGYTPRLRLFYDHTIKDGMPSAHKNDKFDTAKSMFGYAVKDKSYKSRISFSDAVMTNDQKALSPVHMVLAEPKASSYNDYLKTDQQGKAISYAGESFELRGVKQYWLHGDVERNEGNGNEKVMTAFSPLPSGTEFSGTVRFKNLRKEELGLLLWAIRLEAKSHQNIGKAKALGYGNISISSIGLRSFDLKKAYSLEGLELNPWNDFNKNEVDELINEYKAFMAAQMGVDDVMKLESIETFFKMKDDSRKPAPEMIRFMDINKKEYQNRRPLDDVDGVLSKK